MSSVIHLSSDRSVSVSLLLDISRYSRFESALIPFMSFSLLLLRSSRVIVLGSVSISQSITLLEERSRESRVIQSASVTFVILLLLKSNSSRSTTSVSSTSVTHWPAKLTVSLKSESFKSADVRMFVA